MAKIIIVGNSSVGKTSLVLRYTWNGKQDYELCHTPTIGLDFKTKNVKYKDKLIKLQIWDTAGQERFRNITETYYHGVSGIIIAYSVSDRKSFEEVSEWMYQINAKAEEDVPKIIVANKCELASSTDQQQGRMVDAHEGRMLAEKYKAQFLQVSAKENINVEQIFTTLTACIMKQAEKNNGSENSNLMVYKKSSKTLQDKPEVRKKENCCA